MANLGTHYIDLRVDTSSLAGDIRRAITQRAISQAGAANGGAYATAFRTVTDRALRELPTPRVSLQRLPQVDRELNALHRDLARLTNQRIGVDIDAGAAHAEVQRIQRELTRLGSTHADPQVRADTAGAALQLSQLEAQLNRIGRASPTARVNVDTRSLDTFTGRLGVLLNTAVLIGPAIVPAAAAAAGAVTALGAAAVSAVAGVGAVALAMAAPIKAVKALSDASDGSAAHLKALNQAMAGLAPAGRSFAEFIFSLRSDLDTLQRTAQTGFLPGLQAGIQSLLQFRAPVLDFVRRVSEGMGQIAQETLSAFGSDKWRPFFSYVSSTAVPTMFSLAEAVRNVALGTANIITAFAPMQRQVFGGLVEMTQRFVQWSDLLGQNSGLRQFVEYATTRGPIVFKTLADLASTILHVLQAYAPIGDVVLRVLSGIASAIQAIPVPVLTALLAAFTALRLASLLAALPLGAMATGLRGVATGSITARAALGGVVGFLGGPWTLAIAAATIGLGIFLQKQAEQKAHAEAARTALQGYADALRTGITPETAKAAGEVLRQDDNLRRLIGTLEDAGISQTRLVAGLNGDRQVRQGVVDSINTQIAALETHTISLETENGAITQLDPVAKKQIDRLREARDAFTATTGATDAATAATDRLTAGTQAQTPVQRALAEAERVLGDETASVGQKVNALRTAQDLARQSTENRIETEESYNRALLTLKDTLDGNTKSLGMNSVAALNNRDRIEDVVKSSYNMYEADLQAGVGIDQATAKHKARIAKLIEEAVRNGANEAEVRKLVKAYDALGATDPTVDIKTRGAEAALDQLKDMRIAQIALERGISISQAKTQVTNEIGIAGISLASGGYVRGPGTSTSDSIRANLSDEEYVVRASSVRKVGVPFMDAVNRGLIVPDGGYGDGYGYVSGRNARWPYPVDLSKTKTNYPLPSPAGGGSVSTNGLRTGILGVLSALRSAFGNVPVISGYRPGSRTLSGNVSYHASGRAIDIAPILKWAAFLRLRYGSQLRELISPWNGLNVLNGRPHEYTGAVWNQHNFAGGNAHIHAAMDRGGYLQPGWNGPLWNGTGRPEAVTPAGTMDEVIDVLERAVAAIERVAPGVAGALTGAVTTTRQQARAY